MSTSTHQQSQPMPFLGPRKSFAYLPQAQQLAVLALVGLLLLVLWPGLLDPARISTSTSVKQGLKPRLPATTAQFGRRLHEHYRFGWLLELEASPQARTRRKVHLALSGLQLVAVAVGAGAGRAVRAPRTPTLGPLRFGQAGKVRASRAHGGRIMIMPPSRGCLRRGCGCLTGGPIAFALTLLALLLLLPQLFSVGVAIVAHRPASPWPLVWSLSFLVFAQVGPRIAPALWRRARRRWSGLFQKSNDGYQPEPDQGGRP